MFGGLIHNALCSGGDGGTVDDRITKINNAETIVNFPLPNGWSIRFKIVFDIVKESYGVYTDPDTSEYIARWIYRYPALFACAYKNGTFMYAANQRHDINYYRIYNTVLAGEKDVLYLQQDFDFGVLPGPDDENSFVPDKIKISGVTINRNSPILNIGYTYKRRVRKYDAYGNLTETQFVDETDKTYSGYMLSDIVIANDPVSIADTIADFYAAYKIYLGG